MCIGVKYHGFVTSALYELKLRIYNRYICLIHQVNVPQPYTITNGKIFYIANLSYCPVLYDEEPLQPS